MAGRTATAAIFYNGRMSRYFKAALAAGCLILFIAGPAAAQLTTFQKLSDFYQLAGFYDKHYAHYQWKKDALGVDELDLVPWVARINASTSDIEYFEICKQYVAQFQDGHSAVSLPSYFGAELGFSVDIYGGKVLIDSIDRTALPASTYPFHVGDELISVDGKSTADWLTLLTRFVGTGNPSATRRLAAGMITSRWQAEFPRAAEVPAKASVVILPRGQDAPSSFTVPWQTSGAPYNTVGPVPDPVLPHAFGAAAVAPDPRARFQNYRLPARRRWVVGFGDTPPVFKMPANFTLRVGAGTYDSIYSGIIFDSSGYKVGFIRIPQFAGYELSSFAKEIAYMNANTDGLVIDVMRNPGGYACEAESMMTYLMPAGLRSIAARLRVSWSDIESLADLIEYADYYELTDEELAAAQQWLDDYKVSYATSRGLTSPWPLCQISQDLPAAKDKKGNSLAYTKPIVVLTDEFSASSADVFPAIFQDNKRGLIYGMRTMGAGGAIQDFPGLTMFSELDASVAVSIAVRNTSSQPDGFPLSPYIENVGVRPDQVADYMTEDNLLNQGKPFVDGFMKLIIDQIRAGAQ